MQTREREQARLRRQACQADHRDGSEAGADRRETDEARQQHDEQPDRDHADTDRRREIEHQARGGRPALASAEAEPDRKHVAHDRGERDAVEHEPPVDLGIEADARYGEIGNDAGREDTFADVDDHDPERERLALRAQRVRAARVAAADRPDVHPAPEITDDEAADHGADQV